MAENDRADKLAIIERILRIPLEVKVDNGDLLPHLRNMIFEEFENDFKQNLTQKDKTYKNVHDPFRKQPWLSKFPFVDRRHITSQISMCTGYELLPELLPRIKVRENPYCECGDIGNLTNMLFECPLMLIPGSDLFHEISKKHKASELLSVYCLLKKLNDLVTKLIIRFLNFFKKEIWLGYLPKLIDLGNRFEQSYNVQ